MSEESPSGGRIICSNSIQDRKRKKIISMVDNKGAESSDSSVNKKSKENDNRGADMKSTEEDNKSFHKKKPSSLKLKLVYHGKWLIEQASSTSDCSGSPLRKKQINLSESAQSLQKENKKNGVFTGKNNQEAPFPPADPSTTDQRSFGPVAGPCTSSTSLHEKLGFSTLNLHDSNSNCTSTTAFTSTSAHARPSADHFPTLSLPPLQLNKRQFVPDMSTRPVPNFTFSKDPNMPALHGPCPMPNLGKIPPPEQPMQENHKKDNVPCHAESDTNKMLRERLKPDDWSEEELDSLWIGVRRHGRGSWDTMLRDPKLSFLKYKTPEDLTAKWQEEQLKFFDESSSKLSKPANKPGLSDEMIARTLHGTRVSGLGVEPTLPFLHKTFVSGGSTSCDVRPQDMASCIPSASRNDKDPSDNNGANLSKLNKLPHWLRDALSVPPSRPHPIPAGPMLPPSASDAVQSPNQTYGMEQKTQEARIPPCKMPGPSSSFVPKDPRVNLNKPNKKEEGKKSEFALRIGTGAKALAGAGAGNPPLELNLNSPAKCEDRTGSTYQAAHLEYVESSSEEERH